MNEMQTQPYFIENSYKLLIVTLSITYFRRSGKAISYTVRKQENKNNKISLYFCIPYRFIRNFNRNLLFTFYFLIFIIYIAEFCIHSYWRRILYSSKTCESNTNSFSPSISKIHSLYFHINRKLL